jgi:hypothetical protein
VLFIYKFTYVGRNGKHIFVPNNDCIRRDEILLRFCSQNVEFPAYFFHYQAGGHVAALHRHLENKFFFRIDIENFFYSISRNRVARTLHQKGFRNARSYADWSCVKNPFEKPSYSLPIGFVQSPVLASLAILGWPLATAIEGALANGVLISVYFDDFIGSAMDQETLASACVVPLLRPCLCALAGAHMCLTSLLPDHTPEPRWHRDEDRKQM